MSSIFTKIIKGEIPSYKIAEDEYCIAFLDINPNAKGHTLCVPKQEIDKLFDLDQNVYEHLMNFSYKIAKALEKTVPCNRVGMAVVGLEIPHAHIHLIPINEMHEMTFQKKITLSGQEFQEIAEKIKQFL
ncbi:HIT family protein [Capnocytophaga catalasegens]|uniref:Hydrolase n=1 Tax=Capnocytophaga catalasegens TaxID=1004260 RepID=A0AAV5AP61_9FLAO|nr:HIT family protein [Capnocytophaga catalasegens]GIZ16335.1 hydrolase [Capnocytophaga catalasegens]GJM49139.1 hydrolase [Capnocytophaga catalasegens]GJM53677.1 hydrolase [Capnocytophaga catalasegens]